MRIRNFASVDTERLSLYLSQLRKDGSLFKKAEFKVGFGLGPVSIDISRRHSGDKNVEKDIDDLVRLLEKNHSLIRRRPNSYNEIYFSGDIFILEENIVATKLLLPAKNSKFPQLTHLTLWISMPRQSKKMERWEADGSVLFLIESFWEDSSYHGMISGCSALQWIVRASQPDQPDLANAYGKSNRAFPIQKLITLGAIDQGKRSISTLYRKRYMSNEEFFERDGDLIRCYDVVGYPIYVELH